MAYTLEERVQHLEEILHGNNTIYGELRLERQRMERDRDALISILRDLIASENTLRIRQCRQYGDAQEATDAVDAAERDVERTHAKAFEVIADALKP